MATIFVQQSQGYIQQIEQEIERLQQLLEQVRAMIQSEEELEGGQSKRVSPRKRTMKKMAMKNALVVVEPKRRGRPKKTAESIEA